MSTLIEIEDIKDANSHNSAMALTRAWALCFKKYALNDNEELSDDPANSFNVFTHLTAQGAAKMMYEQAARINETNESTAVLPKSLLNKISADELKGIFGKPASTTMAFCVKKQDIIENSVVVDSKSGLRRLVVNKGMKIRYESHPEFTLPYDVIINMKPVKISRTNEDGTVVDVSVNNIYAYYDMPDAANDGMRSIYGINNQYISSREMRFEGEVYVAFFIKIFQIERKEIKIYVSDPDTTDTTVSFTNSLVGVDVYRKPSGKNTVEKLMLGTTEGTINTSQNTYNYSYDYKRNKQNYNLIFNKTDSGRLGVGDNLRIIVYTTEGSSGNIDFPYMANNLTAMVVNYDQNLSIATQNAMLNIVVLAFARDNGATGGQEQLSIDEIRDIIIQKKYSRGVLITNQEIINKAKSYGLDCYKTRHDLINMTYRAVGKIVWDDMTLSTGTSTFYFDLSKKEKLIPGYNYYLIEPSDVFKYDKNSKKFMYLPRYSENEDDETVETYEEYTTKYNDSDDPESVLEVSFPFHMRYDNASNPKITVYDMNIKTTEILSFTSYNENNALDKIDIPFLRVQRNPFRGVMDGAYNEDIANTYYITFMVHTGENTLNKMQLQADSETENYVNSEVLTDYMKQYVTFNIEMHGILNGEKYQVDPRLLKIVNPDTIVKDGYIAYQIALPTNNYITEDKEIQMKGVKRVSSLGTDYSMLYPVDTTVKFVLTARFTDVGSTKSADCIAYETEPVQLVRFLTDYFGIDFDIQTTEGGYETYEADVPKTYDEDVYLLNADYDPDNNDPTDPNHYEYATKLDNDGRVELVQGHDETGQEISIPSYMTAHKTGEIVYEYIQLTDVERQNGPLENKEYFVVKDEVNGLFEKVEDIERFEDGVEYYKARAETSHKKGDVKIFNKKTGQLVTDANGMGNPLHEMRPLPPVYTGIMKNVSWINRLYFSNAEMYETIRDLYIKQIEDIEAIKNIMFDGGLLHMGLKRTSGNSSKYSAYLLNDGSTELIKNIALKFTFRVKFKDNESVEYKKLQIINATIEYVNNIGDNDLSIDGLFEAIKAAVPNIQYINLTQLNNYKNGEVQTILNNVNEKTEVLTVSQKTVTDASGNITFEPNITVNVVND